MFLVVPMQMALAGFVHTPQSPADDTATCLYCNISLSGWEDDDEPLYVYLGNLSSCRIRLTDFRQEHRKRQRKLKNHCPFFNAEKPPPSTRTEARPRSKKLKASEVPVQSTSGEEFAADDSSQAGLHSAAKPGSKAKSSGSVNNRSERNGPTRKSSRVAVSVVEEGEKTATRADVNEEAEPVTGKMLARGHGKKPQEAVAPEKECEISEAVVGEAAINQVSLSLKQSQDVEDQATKDEKGSLYLQIAYKGNNCRYRCPTVCRARKCCTRRSL
jgi:hypothetical protein